MDATTEHRGPAYGRSERHYEFVAQQMSQSYDMYMKSWSIMVGSVLVGGALGLGQGAAGDGGELGIVMVSIFPLVMCGWFLLASWFWGRFAMCRRYLARLEREIEGSPSLFSREVDWVSSSRGKTATLFTGVIAVIVYVFLAWAASWSLPRLLRLHWFARAWAEAVHPAWYVILYVVLMAIALVIGSRFIRAAETARAG
jgi:hypothetical protein